VFDRLHDEITSSCPELPSFTDETSRASLLDNTQRKLLLKAHVEQVRTALRAASQSRVKEAANRHLNSVNRISDDFFRTLCGTKVQHADYGFVELLGPDGPHKHGSVRLGVSCQGPALLYQGHHHTAQELYIVLRGKSHWWTDSIPAWVERRVSFHASNEHHAMRTGEAPALYFWSWVGELALNVKHSSTEIQSKL